jgi:hypothetical protein
MSERGRTRWPVVVLVGLAALTWLVVRARRRGVTALSGPERAVERGKDAADVVAETTAELLRPPGSDEPPR